MPNPILPRGFTPIVSSYSHDGPGGVMRTEVAGGSARYALDFDRGLQKFNVTLILDKAAFSVWTAFFIHLIKKGAITFDMRLDSGFGVEPHACNIMPGSYNAARTAGINMAVSFVVEAENKAYDFSAADAVAMIDFYNVYTDESDALLRRLAQFALKDTNVLAVA